MSRRFRIISAVALGAFAVLLFGLTILLASLNIDKADKWASVGGVLVTLTLGAASLWQGWLAITRSPAMPTAAGLEHRSDPQDDGPPDAAVPVDLAEAEARLAAMPTEGPLPEVRGSLPISRLKSYRPNPLFVGRESELHRLADLFRRPGQPVVITTGLGGIGKTQLAIEFAYRYGGYFAGGVFWLNFEQPAAVPAEVADCGGMRGLRLYSDERGLSLEDQARLVMAEWEEPVPRLLIFDNCEDQELLREWSPPTGGCRVLVTSRRAGWEPWLRVTAVPLATLPRVESVRLVREFRPDLSADDPDLDAVCAEVGDLPLALHLVGRFLHRYRGLTSVTDYLRELRAVEAVRHRSLDADTTLLPTGHVGQLSRTFQICSVRLDPHDPVDASAAAVLVRAALLAPGEPIPADLLILCGAPDESEPGMVQRATDAAVRLTELGLLESTGGAYRVHRLLAAFARDGITGDEARRDVERAVVRAVAERNKVGYPKHLVGYAEHLKWLTDHTLARDDLAAAGLYNEYGRQLYVVGDFAGARRFLSRALDVRERLLGEVHLDTATTLSYLGILDQYSGENSQARDHLSRALAVRQSLLGENHADTASVLNFLGNWAFEAGEFEQARELHQRALTVRLDVLPESHPELAVSYLNVGCSLRRVGQSIEGRASVEKAVELFGRHDVEHVDAVLAMMHLAEIMVEFAEFDGADRLLSRALDTSRRALGEAHPITVMNLISAGRLLVAMWRTAEAEQLSRHAVELSERVYGPEHQRTALFLTELAVVQTWRGSFGEARHLYERAIGTATLATGATSLVTWSFTNQLALHLAAYERFAEALPYVDRAQEIADQIFEPAAAAGVSYSLGRAGVLIIRQRAEDLAEAEAILSRVGEAVGAHYPATHPTAGAVNAGFGALCAARYDYANAEDHYARALDIDRSYYGADHEMTIPGLLRLAGVHQLRRDYPAAQARYDQARAITTRQLGERHPFTGSIVSAEAGLAVNRGDYATAEELQRQVAAWFVERYPPGHPQRLISEYTLAIRLLIRGRYADARPAVERYLEYAETYFPPSHSTVAAALVALATILRDQGGYDRAEPLYRRALAIHEARWGAGHRATIATMGPLGLLLTRAGRHSEAQQLLEGMLARTTELAGPVEQEMYVVLLVLGEMWLHRRALDRAEETLTRALHLATAVAGAGHPDTALARGRLGQVRHHQGRTDEARALLAEALAVLDRQAPETASTVRIRDTLAQLVGESRGGARRARLNRR